ncbi:MAG TPA: MFS transporter [Stellaceae bacterium]|nr:MFS transporter [Stellaceae bacterium]
MAEPRRRGWTRYLRPTASNQMLWLLCLMYLIYYMDRVNVSTAAPLVQRDLGLTHAQLGIAFGAFALPYTIFQVIGGWLGDRFGARRTLGIGGIIVCGATALTGAVTGFTSLRLVRLLLGIGEGAAFPTATRAMATWLPEADWGYAQGITHSFSRVGNALTPSIVVGLIALSSWRGSFIVVGVASFIWVLLWVWFFRDDPRQHPRLTAAERAALPPPRPAAPRLPLRERARQWLRLGRRILPVTAVDFCYGWTLWLFLSWIPSYFYGNFHVQLSSAAFLSTAVFLSGVVGDTVGGLISDRILARTGDLRRARCTVIAGGLFGAAVFLIPVALSNDLTVVTVALSICFFSAELVVAPIWSVPMDIAPTRAATASGIMNLGFGFAGMISPWFFGRMIDATGSWAYPFIASLALLFLGSLLALRLRPDIPFTAEEPKLALAV